MHASRPSRARSWTSPTTASSSPAVSGQSYFGHDEFSLFAPGMKTIDDALELRRRLPRRLRAGRDRVDEDERRHWLTVVVVGAGPTGVELAGQIRELAVRSWRGDFRSFDPTSVRVRAPRRRQGTARDLRRRPLDEGRPRARSAGCRAAHGCTRHDVDAFGVDVQTDGGTERIAARTVIWAAGVQASPLAAMLAEATGAEVDRAGRIATLPDLTLPGSSRGVRRRRHGHARPPPGRRRGRDAGRSPFGEHDPAPVEGRTRRPAVQVPRPRQRCRDRPFPARSAAWGSCGSAASRAGSSGCSSTSRS